MLPCTLFQKKKKKIVKQKLIWVVSLSRFKHIFILRFVIVHKKNKQRKKKTERGALFAFGTIHFTNAVDTFSPSVSTAWRKYTEEVVSQAIDTWTQKPPRGVNVLLVPDFAHLFLFFFAMTSLLFTQKVLKTLYYDWLKFPSVSPLWLSRGRVSFYWWEVRWSEPKDWGGGNGPKGMEKELRDPVVWFSEARV